MSWAQSEGHEPSAATGMSHQKVRMKVRHTGAIEFHDRALARAPATDYGLIHADAPKAPRSQPTDPPSPRSPRNYTSH